MISIILAHMHHVPDREARGDVPRNKGGVAKSASTSYLLQ